MSYVYFSIKWSTGVAWVNGSRRKTFIRLTKPEIRAYKKIGVDTVKYHVDGFWANGAPEIAKRLAKAFPEYFVGTVLDRPLHQILSDEVADVSDDPSEDAQTHGGSGNSQEVEHGAETAAKEASKSCNEAPLAAVNTSSGEYDDQQPDAGELTFNGMGGFIPSPPIKIGESVMSGIGRSMERLFTGFKNGAPSNEIGGMAQSPRLSGMGVVKELVCQRYQFNRARKKELKSIDHKILVAADGSGSCSTASGVTFQICEWFADKWPEVIFVSHANGDINSIRTGGHTKGLPMMSKKEMVDLWKSLGRDAIGMLFLGDQDGFDTWSKAWDGTDTPVVFLESYCCTQREPRFKHHTNFPAQNSGSYRREAVGKCNVWYADATGSHETVAFAIREILRRKGSL
jgi:hypothetical protein